MACRVQPPTTRARTRDTKPQNHVTTITESLVTTTLTPRWHGSMYHPLDPKHMPRISRWVTGRIRPERKTVSTGNHRQGVHCAPTLGHGVQIEALTQWHFWNCLNSLYFGGTLNKMPQIYIEIEALYQTASICIIYGGTFRKCSNRPLPIVAL